MSLLQKVPPQPRQFAQHLVPPPTMATLAALPMVLLVALLSAPLAPASKVQHKVRCLENSMKIEVVRPDVETSVYLENLKDYPDRACHPLQNSESGRLLTFELPLDLEKDRCGLMRVHNTLTGRSVYYHHVVVESVEGGKQLLQVKCTIDLQSSVTRSRRNVLPAGFTEPEDLEITRNVTIQAPEPQLGVAVRQAGELLKSGELNVRPGTELQMELRLDPTSAPIYGLLVAHMEVSDTRSQEEIIILKGCSLDPYLFENFYTEDGDLLRAKFRAFKFPDSTYVQFKGTVHVCLDKCQGVPCSNGKIGYGRRRRAVSELPADPNKIFEISMSTFLKVDYEGDQLMEKGRLSAILEPLANRTEEVSQKLDVQNLEVEGEVMQQEKVREEERYTLLLTANTSAATSLQLSVSLLVSLLLSRLLN
ncbi:hypothetical protein B566_EDAN012454 [Ephemera danica]|nr:hypothetical protein B566_EDAN012454 [Ephemera danica]